MTGLKIVNQIYYFFVTDASPKEKTTSVVIGNTTITLEKNKLGSAERPIKCDDEEMSDRDEAEGDESELEESSSDPEVEDTEAKKTTVTKLTRDPVKQ